MLRAILDYIENERAAAIALLEADLLEQQQNAADLAAENERQVERITEQEEVLVTMAAEKATIEGKSAQLNADLLGSREEVQREREAAENARTELAKALLRLEAMPALQDELTTLRGELAKERSARIEAEKQAAVLTAQKDALEERLAEVRQRRDYQNAP